jgi:hypothetical protein
VYSCRLTSKLSGARLRRPNRSYSVPIHRLPPTITEDEAACPLQRKLDARADQNEHEVPLCHRLRGERPPRSGRGSPITSSVVGVSTEP